MEQTINAMTIPEPPTGVFDTIQPHTEFEQEFTYTPDSVDVIDTFQGAGGEIVHCSDGTYEAYVKPIRDDSPHTRSLERHSTYRGYQFCKAIGIPTPAHVFGDGWFASEGVDGERLSIVEIGDIDALMTLLAKSMVGGMTDVASQNIIIDSSENMYVIDLEACRNVSKRIYTIRTNCAYCLERQDVNIHLVECIEARAASMVHNIPDRLSNIIPREQLEERAATVPFEDNIQYARNNFPISRPHVDPFEYDIWYIDPCDWPD